MTTDWDKIYVGYIYIGIVDYRFESRSISRYEVQEEENDLNGGFYELGGFFDPFEFDRCGYNLPPNAQLVGEYYMPLLFDEAWMAAIRRGFTSFNPHDEHGDGMIRRDNEWHFYTSEFLL